jgi:hypothetical protein
LIAQRRAKLVEEPACNPFVPEPLALECEECDLFERIQRAQTPGEFEAIDDHDRRSERNVLRSQIAMTVAEASRAQTDLRIMVTQELELQVAGPPRQLLVNPRCPGQQRAPGGKQAQLHPPRVTQTVQSNAFGAGIEAS